MKIMFGMLKAWRAISIRHGRYAAGCLSPFASPPLSPCLFRVRPHECAVGQGGWLCSAAIVRQKRPVSLAAHCAIFVCHAHEHTPVKNRPFPCDAKNSCFLDCCGDSPPFAPLRAACGKISLFCPQAKPITHFLMGSEPDKPRA